MNRASLKASRLLNTAAATLAASVLTDSTAEHYRAGFHNRVMFIAPAVSAATLATATAFAFAPRRQGVLPGSVFAAAVVTGLVGFGFHLTNVSRRVGGWNSANVFHGAPIAAPLATTMAGLLGIAASRLAKSKQSNDGSLPPCTKHRASVALGSLSALGLAGTTMEAGALHFRGAFQNPFMYAPVAIPPIAVREAWRLGLEGIDHESRRRIGADFRSLPEAGQDAVLRAIQAGDVDGELWARLAAQRFFTTVLLKEVVGEYYAHPAAWSEFGFGGPASPRGYVRLGPKQRDPWEAPERDQEAHRE